MFFTVTAFDIVNALSASIRRMISGVDVQLFLLFKVLRNLILISNLLVLHFRLTYPEYSDDSGEPKRKL